MRRRTLSHNAHVIEHFSNIDKMSLDNPAKYTIPYTSCPIIVYLITETISCVLTILCQILYVRMLMCDN